MSETEKVSECPLNVIVRSVNSCEHDAPICGQFHAHVGQTGTRNWPVAVRARVVNRYFENRLQDSKLVYGAVRPSKVELRFQFLHKIAQREDGVPIWSRSTDDALEIGAPATIGMLLDLRVDLRHVALIDAVRPMPHVELSGKDRVHDRVYGQTALLCEESVQKIKCRSIMRR